MTATNNLPLTQIADTVLVNNQGNTCRMSMTTFADMVGGGGGEGSPSLAAEVDARIAGDDELRTAAGVAMRDTGVMTLANVGGTGDAITADLPAAAAQAGVTTTSATSMIEIVPTMTNSGASGPTLSIGGGAAAFIRSESGAVLTAGQLVGGRSYILRRSGGVWRIVAGAVALADIAAARTDRTIADAQMGTVTLESVAGTGDAITGAVPTTLTAVGIAAANLRGIRWQCTAANTGAVTINIDGQGALSLRDAAGAVLPAGYLVPGRYYEAVKVSTTWRLAGGEVTRPDLTAAVNAAASTEATARTAADAALRAEMRQRTVQLAQSVLRSGGMTAALRDQILNDGADVRLYPGAPATITEGKVTAMTATGRLGLAFAATSSPNIDLLPDGIRVNGGYLQWTGVTTPAYTGALILLDVTRNAAPTAGAGNIVSLDLDVGTQAHLRYNAAGLQAMGPDASIALFAAIGGYGVRQQVALLVDYVGRSMTLVSADGVSQVFPLTGAANSLNLNMLRFGASSLVTIHDATVLLAESGVPDLDLFRQVFRQVDAAAAPALPYENVDTDGQSNAVGNDNAVAGRQHLAYLARDRVFMVGGLKTVGGTDVHIHGSGSVRIDTNVPATGIVPAAAAGNHTLGFPMAVALALHRKRLGLPERRLLTGFSGMAGQAAVEFDNDIPTVTGTLGTVIHDNWAYRLSERKRLAGAVAPGYLTLCQGEADRNLAPGVWFGQGDEWLRDRFAVYLAQFGGFPRLGIFQVAGTTNTAGAPWHCKTDQIDLAEFYGGLLLCPMHPFAIGPDGVHFLWQDHFRIADTAAAALAEVEAGRTWPALRPAHSRDGTVLTLRYDLRPDEQLRRITGRYPVAEPHWGYEVEGAAITGVEQIGARVHRLTCSAVPTAVKYALQQRDMTGQGWSAHRGEVATTWTAPSALFAGEVLTRDVPGWRIAL